VASVFWGFQMRKFRRIGLTVAIVTFAAPIGVASGPVSHAVATPTVAAKVAAPTRGDFDGDGKADIVAGAPGGNRVRVIYSKLSPHAKWITPPVANTGDFGASLAIGNFNGDRYSDVAIGAPDFTDEAEGTEQGAVFIYDGSKTGLHYSGTVFKGPDNLDDDNELGTSLAAGDLNGDGFADLAVGNPGPEGGGDGQGSVLVYFGSAAGLTETNRVAVGSLAPAEEGNFGQAVALADVNGDGFRDLIVGEPGGGPQLGTFVKAGDVQVFYGSATGLGAQHATFLGGKFNASGSLGSVLAAGDINHDGFADVVAGAPGATVKGHALAGKILVLFGGKHGLSAKGARVFSKATPHVSGGPVSTDRFGFAVAVGDLNADRRADVIVGVPGGSPGRRPAAGAVYIFPGTKSGVSAAGSVLISQATKGVPGGLVSGAEFGSAVATIGAATAAHRDLLIGVPAKHKGGWVIELRGGPHGVSGSHARVFKDSQPMDTLGAVLAL
jgi:hypothetical protein